MLLAHCVSVATVPRNLDCTHTTLQQTISRACMTSARASTPVAPCSTSATKQKMKRSLQGFCLFCCAISVAYFWNSYYTPVVSYLYQTCSPPRFGFRSKHSICSAKKLRRLGPVARPAAQVPGTNAVLHPQANVRGSGHRRDAAGGDGRRGEVRRAQARGVQCAPGGGERATPAGWFHRRPTPPAVVTQRCSACLRTGLLHRTCCV